MRLQSRGGRAALSGVLAVCVASGCAPGGLPSQRTGRPVTSAAASESMIGVRPVGAALELRHKTRNESPFAIWGAEILGQTHACFSLPESGLYGEEIGPGRGRPHPSWLWPSTVQLAALAGAAKLHPESYRESVRKYVDALRSYRTQYEGLVAFDVNPAPKPHDRYFDDNAWMVLSLLEAWEATHDPADLELAQETFQFVLSGQDQQQGGGIYWHERQHQSKHACSTGPAAVAALRLYQVTGDRKYFDAGKALYDWMLAKLEDRDGLVCDSISLKDGTIDRAKYSYNTASLIQANCLLCEITGKPDYLRDAERIARAAEKQWVLPESGAIADESKFAHKLLEAFLAVYALDHDAHWSAVAVKCLQSLRRSRDPQGWYPSRWDATPKASLDPIRLIDQASAARAYWVAASHGIELDPAESR